MKTNLRIGIAVALTAVATISLPGMAGQVGNLVTFTSGTTAKSSEVNGNFTAVKTAVDDNQAQITALNARIAALEARLTNIAALNDYLSLQTVNGQPTVRVAAANLQVVNGTGRTDSINGTGNVLIGYDESRADTDYKFCSQATLSSRSGNYKYTLQDDIGCAAAGAVFAVNHKSGSHNLIVGPFNNYSNYGGAVFGIHNAIAYSHASITGGENNISAGTGSSVTGGRNNQAFTFGTVSGGEGNVADGDLSVVSGGVLNWSAGEGSVVSGGLLNLVRGKFAAISGGSLRVANGENNWAAGTYSADR